MRFNKAKCASSTGGCFLWTTCTVDMRGYKYTSILTTKVFVTAVFGKQFESFGKVTDALLLCLLSSAFVPLNEFLLLVCLREAAASAATVVLQETLATPGQAQPKTIWDKECKETWSYTNTYHILSISISLISYFHLDFLISSFVPFALCVLWLHMHLTSVGNCYFNALWQFSPSQCFCKSAQLVPCSSKALSCAEHTQAEESFPQTTPESMTL